MNQPQVIIHSKAGHKVPKELFETALRKCPTVSGFCVRDTDDNKTSLESDKYDQTIGVDDLMKLNNQTEKYDAVYYLANMPSTHTKDDIQPFVLTIFEDENDKVGKDILATFIEGDIPKYSDPKSGHTDEYNFYNDIVLPTLQDYFISADQDMGKFIASLHKPLFEKSMKAHLGHRGVFLFLPLEGDPIKFGTNDLGAELDWGSCSNHLDFAKAVKPITKAVDAVKAATKKFNPFAKPGAEEVKTDDNGIHHIEKKDEPVEKTATAINAGKHLVKPPTGLDKSGRNRWLRLMNNGNLPDKHDHRDFAGVWVTSDILPFAERTGITTVAQVDALGAEMRTGVRKVGATSFVEKSKSVADFLPILDDKEMIELTGTLAKFIDRKNVPTALDIQKMEAPWATFTQKGGIKYEDTDCWTVNDAFQLPHKALVLLWAETRRREMLGRNPDLLVKDIVGTETSKHVEAKKILAPDGTPAVKSAADKRAALFGLKKSA